jgi:homoserine dehydrogenase
MGATPAADVTAARTAPGAAVRVGVLGCGNVGAALVEMIDAAGDDIARRTGVRLEVVRVAVRDAGPHRGRSPDPDRLTEDAAAVVTDPDVDVVVELIGGIEPARTLVTEALTGGKPVVTANKDLLANAGRELLALAGAAGVDLLYEAAVAGAIPLVRPLSESLAGERILRVMGIVNGTTNYILTRMTEEGIGYSEALEEAQQLGYAERDPTADVEGHDASAKAAILAGLAFNADVVAGDVYREGIVGIEATDIEFARRLGYVVKLLAVAERVDGPDAAAASGRPVVAVRVHPAMVPADHPLAQVRGAFNAVFIEGEAAGELMLYGRGAGGRPTASAVLGDLIDAAHNLRSGGRGRWASREVADVRPIDELRSQYYLTADVVDQPGVLAAVATEFGSHRVSIRSMEQVGLGDEARLVFITHEALEADLQATLAGLRALDVVDRVGKVLRVIGPEGT